MARAWQVVPMDVFRYWNVDRANGAEARQIRCHLLIIELVRTESLKDLRACAALRATIKHPTRRQATGHVWEVHPPDRRFVSAHVKVRNDVLLRPALVRPHHPTVDLRPSSIDDDAVARFVLIKAIEDRAANKRAGLRRTDVYHSGDGSGDRVRMPCFVCFFVAKERDKISRRGKTDPKHKRVLHRVYHLIELVRVKSPVAQANKVRVRRAGWPVRTIGPGPVGNLRLRAVYARSRLGC